MWLTNTKTGKRFNTDWTDKDRQIAQSAKEADIRNKSLPRRLYLPDMSADKANQTSDILNLRTKQRYRFKNGTTITEIHAFAGKGCLKVFEKADRYASRYPESGKRKEDWQHCSGIGYITNGKNTLKAEVHWVQGNDGKIREAFIKEILK